LDGEFRGEGAPVRRPVLAVVIVVLLATSTVAFRGMRRTAEERPAAAAALPFASEPAHLDPAELTSRIDHPYWPMRPGSRWVYRQTDAGGSRRIEVTVTHRTRTVMGAQALVVHDVATEDGEVVEDTYDWYAQDDEGNIWYLGEDTKEFENGKLKTTEGSWEHGVDGALGGIILPAHPRPGLTYREEYYKGHAEDGAEILSLSARAKVPYGTFEHCRQTMNFSPLEPNLVEEKFYARGVGVVLEITVSGGSDRAELLSFRKGR
jgi:hypothetical protein